MTPAERQELTRTAHLMMLQGYVIKAVRAWRMAEGERKLLALRAVERAMDALIKVEQRGGQAG